MKKNISFTLLTLLVVIFSVSARAQGTDFNVVPRPLSITSLDSEDFMLTEHTRIFCGKSKAAKRNAEFLKNFLCQRTGFTLTVTPQSNKALQAMKQAITTDAQAQAIVLTTDATSGSNPEGYKLLVNEGGISITGVSDAGTFYGIQTLRKALPHRTVNIGSAHINNHQRRLRIPATEIIDAPRFAYRGTHLDVSRHFVTTDSIYRFIDMLALHNINRFHWHLTDDQGWRIEIKKYPRLTTIGSKRSETVIGHNSGVYDGKPYGGFYTQKECKAIVKYAAERNITIVPEIDMPGHMLGALAAYPELGCTGGPYDVWRIWGVSDDVLCAGNDKTLKFIDDVLDEITKIFPSEYIHVGGDECPKGVWQKCPKCQARIKAEHLEARDGHSAEERLQSYIIRHAEAHLSKLGRKMIGWDETLEGGLAEGATVMSWRGEAGGIEAARQNHDAIMTPNTYLYLDYYQSLNTEREPMGFGGYVPLKRVYSYEPVPDKLIEEGIDRHIIGVQANLWTEYMPTYRQVEYMAMPRLAALADVQWTQRGTKDYDEFCQRAVRLIGVYDEMGYNYARHIYDVNPELSVDAKNRCIVAQLKSVVGAPIVYSLDGSDPDGRANHYEQPIAIKEDCNLKTCTLIVGPRRAGSPAKNITCGNVETVSIHFNKATASPIVLLNSPASQYTFAGAETLIDGITAANQNFQSSQWIGFNGKDLDAIIDLGSEQSICSVSFNTNVDKGSWIFDCSDFGVWGYCETENVADLEALKDCDAHELAHEDYGVDAQDTPNGIRTHTISFAQPCTLRYLRLKASCLKAMPEWHGGKGRPAFLFVDEISVK